MQIVGWLEVFATGAFGGALLELLRWWKLRESDRLPAYAKSPLYWGVTIAMILAGGGLALLYGFAEARSALIVLNLGASAPAIIGALATPRTADASERVVRGVASQTRTVTNIRRFLAFR